MENSLLDRFKELEKKVDDNKIQKVRYEEQLKTLESEREKFLNELKTLGIKEEDLSDKIESLQKEINEELTKCQQILN